MSIQTNENLVTVDNNYHNNPNINFFLDYIKYGGFAEINFACLVTAINEKVLLKSQGQYSYRLPTYNDQMRIPLLESMYDDGINSPQIPPMERCRNRLNKSFYFDKVLPTRQAGNFDNVLVEFSPSPILTEEMKARGYDGYHCLQIWQYLYDSNCEEVTVYWIDKNYPIDIFQQLANDILQDNAFRSYIDRDLSQLANTHPTELTDLVIMQASGSFDQSELLLIKNFIDRYRLPMVTKKIESYVYEELVWSINSRLVPLVEQGASKLAMGQDVSQELTLLEDTISALEFTLWLKFQEIVNPNFSGVSTAYSNNTTKFTDMSLEQQVFIMQQCNFVSSHCGGSKKYSTESAINVSSIRIFPDIYTFFPEGIMDTIDDGFGDREFECGSCGEVIKRGYKKLVSECPHCHSMSGVRCLEL
jgi:hypothetical protein